MAEGHRCTSRSPDVSLRGAKRRGNLAVPGRIMGKLSAKTQLPSRDCHVGLWPPRNDKSESFTPQNAYRKSCQSAWRSASALYRGIKPQEGTGAPRVPLTCHCEERSDVAISQYPAASWESYRRKRNCLPEIATSAFGLLAMTNLRASRHRMRTVKVASLHGAH